MSTLGYVVVEFNQASGQPELSPFSYLTNDREEALERLEVLKAENRKAGRRERYIVAEVFEEDE